MPGGLSTWRIVRPEDWRTARLENCPWRVALLEDCLLEVCPPGGPGELPAWRVARLEGCPPGELPPWRGAPLESYPPGGVPPWRVTPLEDRYTGGLSTGALSANPQNAIIGHFRLVF